MPFAALSRLAWLKHSLAAVALSGVAAASAITINLPAGVLPDLGQAPASASAAAASAPTAQDWARRLASAGQAHRALMAQRPGSSPLLLERQAASERLLTLLTARVEAERAPSASRAAVPANATGEAKLTGVPPYSVVDVDTLRDHLEELKVRQSSLRLTLKSFDTEVEATVAARTAANAERRRRQEEAAQGGAGAASGEKLARAELADLQTQTAELELLQAESTRQGARQRLAALDEPIAQAQAEVDRVRQSLRLDDAAVATLSKRFAAEAQKLAAERSRLAEQLARREAETTDEGGTKLREIEALRQAMAALRELESLETGKAGLWRTRLQSLAPDQTPDQKRETAAGYARAIEQSQARQHLAAEQSDLLRTEVRAQQSLMRGLPEADAARAREQRVLDALGVELAAQERLQAALYRVGVLLARSRADLGVADKPASTMGWAERASEVAAGWLTAVWNYELFSASETTQIDGRSVTVDHGVTVGKSVGVLVMFALGYWLSGLLSRLLVTTLARRLHLTSHMERLFGRWFKTLLLMAVLLAVLKMARIPITAFAFLGGALVLGVGFGAQNVIKNLICGVIILFERKIRVGDIVTIGGMSGTVLSVDLRATTVRGFDGIDAIVPNSNLLENPISNWSGGSPNIRRMVDVSVAHGCDVRQASSTLLGCAAANPAVLQEPPPVVLLEDFGGGKYTLRLQYWIRLGAGLNGPDVDSDLRYAILDALQPEHVGVKLT